MKTLFRLLADPVNLDLIENLGRKKKSMTELAQETRRNRLLLSMYLDPLEDAGLVERKKEKSGDTYAVAKKTLITLLNNARKIVEAKAGPAAKPETKTPAAKKPRKMTAPSPTRSAGPSSKTKGKPKKKRKKKR